jgi:hypothetical protein
MARRSLKKATAGPHTCYHPEYCYIESDIFRWRHGCPLTLTVKFCFPGPDFCDACNLFDVFDSSTIVYAEYFKRKRDGVLVAVQNNWQMIRMVKRQSENSGTPHEIDITYMPYSPLRARSDLGEQFDGARSPGGASSIGDLEQIIKDAGDSGGGHGTGSGSVGGSNNTNPPPPPKAFQGWIEAILEELERVAKGASRDLAPAIRDLIKETRDWQDAEQRARARIARFLSQLPAHQMAPEVLASIRRLAAVRQKPHVFGDGDHIKIATITLHQYF